MKKALLLASLLVSVFTAGLIFGSGSVLLGGLVSVNGTSNSVPVALTTSVYIPSGTFLIQNGGLASTNALLANVQLTLDGTNYLTVATYHPTVTNATTDTFQPVYTNQTISMRLQIITTNAVNVGSTYLQ